MLTGSKSASYKVISDSSVPLSRAEDSLTRLDISTQYLGLIYSDLCFVPKMQHLGWINGSMRGCRNSQRQRALGPNAARKSSLSLIHEAGYEQGRGLARRATRLWALQGHLPGVVLWKWRQGLNTRPIRLFPLLRPPFGTVRRLHLPRKWCC